MTIDELIEELEQCKYINGSTGYKNEELACKIAIATLKANKHGLRMCKYTPLFEDYEPVQTELDEILNNLGE
jgi:hypothetical protein